MSEAYVHGYSAEEQSRLTAMQTILNAEELKQIDLAEVRTVLDVGAGLGQMTRSLAKAVGRGARVVGVERDERQRNEAVRQAEAAGERHLIDLRAGDAVRLPLSDAEWGSFDLVHARFLLEHISEPEAALAQMAKAARPGGRVILMDDDHDQLRLWPDAPRYQRIWQLYWQSYRDHGHDPLVGRRLVALLIGAGLQPCRVDTVFYGAAQGMPLFEPIVDNLNRLVEGAAKDLVATGRATSGEITAALAELAAWRTQPSATVWYSLPIAEGMRPAP